MIKLMNDKRAVQDLGWKKIIIIFIIILIIAFSIFFIIRLGILKRLDVYSSFSENFLVLKNNLIN